MSIWTIHSLFSIIVKLCACVCLLAPATLGSDAHNVSYK